MTFMDVMEMRSVGGGSLSPDGARVVYTVSLPHWKSGKNYTDVFVADAASGVARQMTFTREKNETGPQWARDGRRFAFLSDREGSQQVYLMAVEGGEARKLTEAKDGVHAFAFSRDGKWLAFSAGKAEDRQLSLVDLASEDLTVTALPKHATPIRDFAFAEDGGRLFFTSPDRLDKDDVKRKEKKFDVRLADPEQAPVHLWSLDLKDKAEKRWTEGAGFTVAAFQLSKDGRWASYRALPTVRRLGDITQEEASLHLLDLGTGKARMVLEKYARFSAFSPDGQWLVYAAPERFERLRNGKLWVAPTAGGPAKNLLAGRDLSVSAASWSEDSRTLYFTEAVGVDQHLFAVSVADGALTQLTKQTGVLAGGYHPEAKAFLLTYSHPRKPMDLYVAKPETVGSAAAWVKVSDSNPQVAKLALGSTETVRWKARDGVEVEGLLIKPLGYEKGRRYPLIVQLHGGPAGADMNTFQGRYVTYPHVYAAAGYAVLQPNYRGSTNYGEAFTRQIGGNFMRLSYGDIISGVDHLIREGIADPDRLGMMGWSAGGHLSSWTLTQTDRFKAISTGAGAVNWISMYAESDVQSVREFYLGGQPYDAWDAFVNESALKYVKNAKTPTLIHVGEADQRVPKPQSDELYMALKKLGVPVEYIVYPGMPHGLTEPRYQLVKMVSEFHWFEKWIKGRPDWFDWKALLDTLPADAEAKPETPAGSAASRRR
ncbi:MAG: prolyl oligopeptidase family serine peptidase [Holophagaceae bacterium]|uniref:Prolyl oligopeptidase family serine peptidase n=1 Tax=Candidatus Geothrix odensensis TaxID=2954440 RepID=A0A936K519_9BACT|nr:prolyl oligopeptidase family serine peptidase [Candidatus Geothrix odensensis]